MATNKIYNQAGGTIGGKFTVLKTVVDCTDGLGVGDFATDLVVPANSFVLNAFIGNVDNDLASGGAATLNVKVGSTAIFATAEAISGLKGSGALEVEDGTITTEDSAVSLTVGTAALTAGTVTLGVTILTL